MAVHFYLINPDAILNGKKVNNLSRLFWVSNDEEKKELSEAFLELKKEKTAKSILRGFVYVFDFRTVFNLREKGKLQMNKASGKPPDIEKALGLKVYNANKKVMEVYDQFPLSIFKAMKDDNTLVGKKAMEYENAFIEGAKSEDEDDSGILKG